MTTEPTPDLVAQVDRDAAERHYPPHLWREEAIADLAQAFAEHRLSALTEASEPSGITKDWCLNMAQMEGDAEIGAGVLDHPLRCPPTEASEPVAWMYENESGERTFEFNPNGDSARWLLENGYTETPLYSHPQPSEAERIAKLEEALRLFKGAAYPVSTTINPRGYNWSEAYLDQALENAATLKDKSDE